jgi:hypothetical protein
MRMNGIKRRTNARRTCAACAYSRLTWVCCAAVGMRNEVAAG